MLPITRSPICTLRFFVFQCVLWLPFLPLNSFFSDLTTKARSSKQEYKMVPHTLEPKRWSKLVVSSSDSDSELSMVVVPPNCLYIVLIGTAGECWLPNWPLWFKACWEESESIAFGPQAKACIFFLDSFCKLLWQKHFNKIKHVYQVNKFGKNKYMHRKCLFYVL